MVYYDKKVYDIIGVIVMRSKRKEAFRYTFPNEIPALFTIRQVDGKDVLTSKGEASIINLSPQGLMMSSTLNIPIKSEKTIHLSIAFQLNNTKLQHTGTVTWKKEKYNRNEYGIKLLIDEMEQREIIEELKKYAKANS